MPMQNGQMPMQNMGQNQFGQPHYHGQYQQPANGQQPYAGKPGSGPYYSPYAQSGNYGQAHGMRQGSNGAYPANASQTPQPHAQGQQPVAPLNPFQPVVDAIMHYRTAYLGAPTVSDDPGWKVREEAFNRGTDYFSTLYHGNGDATVTDAEISGVEPFMTLKAIFERHKYLFAKKPEAATPASGEGTSTLPGGQPVKQDNSADGSVAVPGPPQPSGQAPAPTSDLEPVAASHQPANLAVPTSEQARVGQTTVAAGQDQDVVMSDAAISTANTTAAGGTIVRAASSMSVSAPTTTTGTPASVAMASSAITTKGPPAVVAPTATAPIIQPSNEATHPGGPPHASNELDPQPMSNPSATQPPAVPADLIQPGEGVPVTQPAVPAVTPTAEQATEKLSDPLSAGPLASQSADPAPQSSVATPMPRPPSTGSEQTPAAAVPAPLAGTKRSADGSEDAVEETDAKRSKLSE